MERDTATKEERQAWAEEIQALADVIEEALAKVPGRIATCACLVTARRIAIRHLGVDRGTSFLIKAMQLAEAVKVPEGTVETVQ